MLTGNLPIVMSLEAVACSGTVHCEWFQSYDDSVLSANVHASFLVKLRNRCRSVLLKFSIAATDRPDVVAEDAVRPSSLLLQHHRRRPEPHFLALMSAAIASAAGKTFRYELRRFMG